MQKSSIDHTAALDRLASAYGCRTDAELSAKLGVSRGTLSSWRTRSSVPIKEYVELAQPGNLSIEWVLFGRGPAGIEDLEKCDAEHVAFLEKFHRGTIALNNILGLVLDDLEKEINDALIRSNQGEEIDAIPFIAELIGRYQRIFSGLVEGGYVPPDIVNGFKRAWKSFDEKLNDEERTLLNRLKMGSNETIT